MKEENDKENEKRMSKDADVQMLCLLLLLGVIMLSILLAVHT